MSNILPSQIVVKGQIADSSGHTEFSGSIDEAMDLIMNHVTKLGKWVYVNGNPFMFTNKSIAEQKELRNMLETAENPTFMLTPELKGGAPAVATRTVTTKRPLRGVLNARNRAHLAVSIGRSKGKPHLDVTVTDYRGKKADLRKYRSHILKAVFEALEQ